MNNKGLNVVGDGGRVGLVTAARLARGHPERRVGSCYLALIAPGETPRCDRKTRRKWLTLDMPTACATSTTLAFVASNRDLARSTRRAVTNWCGARPVVA